MHVPTFPYLMCLLLKNHIVICFMYVVQPIVYFSMPSYAYLLLSRLFLRIFRFFTGSLHSKVGSVFNYKLLLSSFSSMMLWFRISSVKPIFDPPFHCANSRSLHSALFSLISLNILAVANLGVLQSSLCR